MLTLGISTSAGQFALVLGESGRVIYDSCSSEPAGGELDDLLLKGLNACGKDIAQIAHVIVDTGPGGTSRVRTGVAFANSLAYGLHVPVCPVSSMELSGLDAFARYGVPVVSTVKSIRGNAYVGYCDGRSGSDVQIEYGRLDEIVPRMVARIDRFVTVGAHRETIARLPALADTKTVIDSGMMYGNARLLIEKSDLFTGRGLLFPEFALPVTEQTI
jgi:tRNA A37 threonylcarbamoyladenosine modification protein TsaB